MLTRVSPERRQDGWPRDGPQSKNTFSWNLTPVDGAISSCGGGHGIGGWNVLTFFLYAVVVMVSVVGMC